MIHLRDHLEELAEAAARDGRTAGPMAAIRRGRQRRRRLAGGTAALLAAVLVAGAVGADQLGPLLDDPGLLHPFGEARLLEVAGQGLSEGSGLNLLLSQDSVTPRGRSLTSFGMRSYSRLATLPFSTVHTGSSRLGGSSSARGLVTKTCLVSGPRSRAARRV